MVVDDLGPVAQATSLFLVSPEEPGEVTERTEPARTKTARVRVRSAHRRPTGPVCRRDQGLEPDPLGSRCGSVRRVARCGGPWKPPGGMGIAAASRLRPGDAPFALPGLGFAAPALRNPGLREHRGERRGRGCAVVDDEVEYVSARIELTER